MNDIVIKRWLPVIPGPNGGSLLVPGCEPTSSVTSIALMRQMRCGRAIVDVNVALQAIPGSYIKFISNYGGASFSAGPRGRIFFLPSYGQDCEPDGAGGAVCPHYQVDWFEVLRSLANEPTTEENRYNPCDVVGMGLCPSPGFKNFKPPPPPTYFKEGTDILFKTYTP